MTRTAPPAGVGGFAGWILAKQAEFYRMLSGLIRAAKADGSAAYTLLGVSFLYGIFHAAGPGHGKAVISSYLVANNETWRRGIVLSFASAMLQAFTAIAIVGIAAALLGATAKAMGNTVRVIEIVSYALIMLIGLRLLWVKGGAFLRLLRGDKPAHHVRDQKHHHHDQVHDHGHGHHHHHSHEHAHRHHHDHEDEASAWGHAHAPEPQELTGRHWLRRGLAAIVAVCLCGGAGLVFDWRRIDVCDGCRYGDHGCSHCYACRWRTWARRSARSGKAWNGNASGARIGNCRGARHHIVRRCVCSQATW
jgi:nickel/cobalt exporter